jgi:hypothetical protein
MWVVFFLLLSLLFSVTPAHADPGFDEKYERDYNIFNPINQYRSDNPLNPINSVDPKNPFNPINSVDPGNPANPIKLDKGATLYDVTHLVNPLNQLIRAIRCFADLQGQIIPI